jgi:hypothetical protein
LVVKEEPSCIELEQEEEDQEAKKQARAKKPKRTAKEQISQTQTAAPIVGSQSALLKREAQSAEEAKPCTCKNGRCAKKYCVCLKRAEKCDPTLCTCRDCENLDSKAAEDRRMEQLKRIQDGSLVRKGCNCKRNKCEQNYCVCFQQGLDCDPKLCECQDCKNVNHVHKDRKDGAMRPKAGLAMEF